MSAHYPDTVSDLPYSDLHPYLDELLARIDSVRQEAADCCGELDDAAIAAGPSKLREDANRLIDLAQQMKALAFDWEQMT